MPILKYMSWAAFAAALINLAIAYETGAVVFVAGAVSLVIAGVLFTVLERIVVALEAIRSAVAPISTEEMLETDPEYEAMIIDRIRQDRILRGEPELSLDELGKRIDAKRAK